jgi:Protein of unknown function (DUF4240)
MVRFSICHAVSDLTRLSYQGRAEAHFTVWPSVRRWCNFWFSGSQAELPEPIWLFSHTMNIDDFWRLTGNIDQAALAAGEESLALAPLVTVLTTLSLKEIRAYEEYLCRMLYQLDCENLARHAGESGESDDGFLYSRCYTVAKGRQYYEMVLASPEHMPKTIEQWCEPLLSVAAQAWAHKTGRSADEWDFEASVSYETASNLAQWPSIQVRNPAEPDPFIEPKFERAVTRAGHAFRSRQYDNVVKLLKQHEARLSHKQRAMLNEACAQLLAADPRNPVVKHTPDGAV